MVVEAAVINYDDLLYHVAKIAYRSPRYEDLLDGLYETAMAFTPETPGVWRGPLLRLWHRINEADRES